MLENSAYDTTIVFVAVRGGGLDFAGVRLFSVFWNAEEIKFVKMQVF